MEGPYLVELTRIDESTWRARCIEDRANRSVRHEGEFPANELLESLVEVDCQVLRFCRANSWWSTDADHLEVGLSELCEFLKRGAAR